MPEIQYTLGAAADAEILNSFMATRCRNSFIMGPLGSGKTYGCIQRILKQMTEQDPNSEGIRPTRWLAVRNTYPDLMNTTVKDFREIFMEPEMGRFKMGSPEDEPGRFSEEGPQVDETIEEGFWMMETPVTQALYEAVTGENSSRFRSPDRPVERVNWKETMSFLEKLNARIPGAGDNNDQRRDGADHHGVHRRFI